MPRQFGELISSPDDSELYYRVSGEHHFMAASHQSGPRFEDLLRRMNFPE
jgi:hypothetical protein